MLYNAGHACLFLQISRNIYDAARCASCSSRDSSDFAESFGSNVATVTTGSDRVSRAAVAGVAHHARQPPRNRMRGLQVGLGKGDDDRSVVLNGAKVHLPHQPADDPRAVDLRARDARDRRQSAPPTIRRRVAGSDRRRWRNRARTRPMSAGRSGRRSGRRRRSTSRSGSNALRRRAGGSAATRSPPPARRRRRRSRGSADRRPAPDRPTSPRPADGGSGHPRPAR